MRRIYIYTILLQEPKIHSVRPFRVSAKHSEPLYAIRKSDGRRGANKETRRMDDISRYARETRGGRERKINNYPALSRSLSSFPPSLYPLAPPESAATQSRTVPRTAEWRRISVDRLIAGTKEPPNEIHYRSGGLARTSIHLEECAAGVAGVGRRESRRRPLSSG